MSQENSLTLYGKGNDVGMLRRVLSRGAPSDLLSMTGLKGDLFAALKGRSSTGEPTQAKQAQSEPSPDTRRCAGCRLFRAEALRNGNPIGFPRGGSARMEAR